MPMMVVEESTQHAILEGQAAARGEDPFLYFKDQVWSFAETERLACRCAAGLQKLGIGKGDAVGIMCGNRPEYVFLWFALSKLGAIQVPVNTAHKGHLLLHMLRLAKVKLILIAPEHLDQFLPVQPELPDLQRIVLFCGTDRSLPLPHGFYSQLIENDGKFEAVHVRPSDPANILFTSGTTGPSKGSLKPQNEGVQTARMTAEVMEYGPADCVYIAIPMFHGVATNLGIFAALVRGARVVIAERFSASGFWPDIRRYGCTAANYVGAMLLMLMKQEEQPDDAENPIRAMFGPGAPPSIFAAFEARFHVELNEMYGLTDAGIPLINRAGHRRSGTCGRVTPYFDVALVDDDGHPVPDGTPGELLLRANLSNYMMLGYVGMPERTLEAWRDLWFHTGDTLIRDPDGFYRFVDRKKDSLRRRGENISSFEVEQAVNLHPAVQESAAIAAPSDLGDDEVMVCVVAKPGQALDAVSLHAHCQGQMAAFMVPRYIRVMAALPKTPTERVEKYKLREEGVTADTWDAGTWRK